MKLTLAELKAQAAAILAIPDSEGEFANKSFSCGTGGSPVNKCGLTEVHRSDSPGYDTVANGRAYSGEVVILCKSTSTKDAEGREIHVTPDGVVFVFRYHRGSPASFDCGALAAPNLVSANE